MDLVCTQFSAHMAMLMGRGDESGIESLTQEFVRANGGGGQEVDELIRLARRVVKIFEQTNPGMLATMLTIAEHGLGRQLDDDG
jgi:hypothetical protein